MLCCIIQGCVAQDYVSQVSKQSLLSCTSVSSDKKIQELGLQLPLGDKYLQTREVNYYILLKACSQLAQWLVIFIRSLRSWLLLMSVHIMMNILAHYLFRVNLRILYLLSHAVAPGTLLLGFNPG